MSIFSSRLVVFAVTGAVATLVAVTAANSQSGRPNSNAMTCGQVQSMISQRGAVVLSTGQYTFDRYVANLNSCQHGEVLRWDYVPTKDNRRCRVSRCVDPQPWRYD